MNKTRVSAARRFSLGAFWFSVVLAGVEANPQWFGVGLLWLTVWGLVRAAG